MINERDVERAAEFMRDNAADLAKAKSERVYLEQFRKSKIALLVLKTEGTIQQRDAYARSHVEYLEVLDGLRMAIEEEERLKWMMEAARLKIEVWRTEQANYRNIDSSHR